LTHIGFEVSDVDAVYERILGTGYKVTSPPVEMRNGRSKLIYVYGPEDLVIEFIELREMPFAPPADPTQRAV
ncbi:MAG: VOC family protein, partial [Rhizobiaceae bacterium]|nr:VOC family protein [Rhizobiaceae bacterium]